MKSVARCSIVVLMSVIVSFCPSKLREESPFQITAEQTTTIVRKAIIESEAMEEVVSLNATELNWIDSVKKANSLEVLPCSKWLPTPYHFAVDNNYISLLRLTFELDDSPLTDSKMLFASKFASPAILKCVITELRKSDNDLLRSRDLWLSCQKQAIFNNRRDNAMLLVAESGFADLEVVAGLSFHPELSACLNNSKDKFSPENWRQLINSSAAIGDPVGLRILFVEMERGLRIDIGGDSLTAAVAANCAECVEMLIEKGASNAGSFTATNQAGKIGNCQIIKLLSKAGFDFDQPDRLNRSPLHFAVADNNIDSVRLLIGMGVNINARTDPELYGFFDRFDGYAPLHIAAEKDNLELAILLVSAGADPLLESLTPYNDFKGKTPIEIAENYKSKRVSDFLRSIEK